MTVSQWNNASRVATTNSEGQRVSKCLRDGCMPSGLQYTHSRHLGGRCCHSGCRRARQICARADVRDLVCCGVDVCSGSSEQRVPVVCRWAPPLPSRRQSVCPFVSAAARLGLRVVHVRKRKHLRATLQLAKAQHTTRKSPS